MQEEFARAGFIVVGDVAVGVGPDMQVEQERFAILDEAVGVFEVGLALADRFDFRPAQRHAGLELLKEKVVMPGGAVMRSVALAAGHGVARPGRLSSGRAYPWRTITWLVWRAIGQLP